MLKNKSNLKKSAVVENFSIIVGALAIAVICSYRIGEKMGMWYGDEFGYVSIAAWLSHFDWHNQMTHIGYYGFGYGLLFFPFIYMCDSINQLMTFLTLLNIGLVIAAYFLCVNSLLSLCPNLEKYKIAGLSMLAILYLGNLAHIQMAWTELLTVFLYWSMINILIHLNRTKRYLYVYLLIFVSCYSVCVHMRNVTMAISAAICAGVIIVKYKMKSIPKLFLSVVELLTGIVVFFLLKGYFKNSVFMNDSGNQLNDIGFVKEIASDFSITEIYSLISSFICKTDYIMCASLILVPCGILFSLKYLSKKEAENKIILLFGLLAFWSAFAITIFFMRSGIRKDNYFYARYYEASLGILIVCGVIEIINWVNRKKYFNYMILLALGKGIFNYSNDIYITLCDNPKYKSFVTLCVPGLTRFILKSDEREVIFRLFVTSLIIVVGMVLLMFWLDKIGLKQVVFFIPIIIPIVFWVSSFHIEADNTVTETNKRYSVVKDIIGNIPHEWQEISSEDVMYYDETGWDEYLLSMQAELGKTQIRNICDFKDLKVENDTYLITKKVDEDFERRIKNIGYVFVCENSGFYLYHIDT